MGTVSVPWKSQLSRTKNGMLKPAGVATRVSWVVTTRAGPELATTRSPAPMASDGGVKLERRVYLPSTDRRGRNDDHAPSTRAAALRRLSIDAFACQLVCAARVPA